MINKMKFDNINNLVNCLLNNKKSFNIFFIYIKFVKLIIIFVN